MPDIDAPFSGPRLKVKRANQHIDNLNDVGKRFVRSNFYTFGLEQESDRVVVRLRQTVPTPWELPLIIGDAIHNLRSSLDIAVCELITRVGGVPTDFTRFQFFNDRDGLVTTFSKGILQGAPDIVAKLADDKDSYRTDDNPIFILHRLDVADKHLLVLPTLRITSLFVERVVIRNGETVTATITNARLGVDEGGVLSLVGFADWGSGKLVLENQGNMQPSFDIFFGDGQPLEGQPIMPTLNQLAQFTSIVIDKFAKWVAERQPVTI